MVKPVRAIKTARLAAGTFPTAPLLTRLTAFQSEKKLLNKGQIATMIFASRLARRDGLPFDVDRGITTEGEGQIKGLGKGAVQTILADYGIDRVLAEEGGRTSRGSLGNIRAFLEFLNEMHRDGAVNLASVEAWWVSQAQKFSTQNLLRCDLSRENHCAS